MHRVAAWIIALTVLIPGSVRGQTAPAHPGFFERVEPVRFTLAVDIRQLRADTADEVPSREGQLSFKDSTGRTITIPVKVKTHGRWRLTHCEFPPLSISFPADHTPGTPFEGLRKARMTSFCKDHPAYEQYILQELQLYRIYQLLTPYRQVSRALHVMFVVALRRRTRPDCVVIFTDLHYKDH